MLREVAHEIVAPVLGPRMLRRGPSTRRALALTFDDGPCDLTSDYLDVLDALSVPATFFVVGEAAARAPNKLANYVARGHQVASHGLDHRRFPELSTRELAAQLRRTDELLAPYTRALRWVRPPYGALSARSLAQVVLSGYTIALWSFDAVDYRVGSPDELIERCRPERLIAGDVLLLHEGERATLAALPSLIRNARASGFEFVTMADLFDLA